MDDQPANYKSLTRELYSKNVDLVNANKTLEMLQKLYEVIIDSLSVESVSQRFIDIITSVMGLPDGLVVFKDDDKDYLRIVGVTQTEVNNTILDISGLSVVEVQFPMSFERNVFVDVFNTRSPRQISNVVDLWTPIVASDDITNMHEVVKDQTGFVYPIVFGNRIFGALAVTHAKKTESLTDFEEKALERVSTVFGIAMDRVSTAEELREAQDRELEKAKELLRLKDEFVFIATHDLRTPVTALTGYISLIKESKEELSLENKENFKAVEDAGHRLNQLVDDLLEVARSESGTLKVSVEPMEIIPVLEKILAEVEPPAKERNVSLVREYEDDKVRVMADQEKLAEVMENLLSNAVKFSRQGGAVRVMTQKQGNMLQISVADNGFGIPKADQPKVFTKFFKARTEDTRAVPGTGLGLFVVRMLVQKMGGDISFVSEEGKGTTFTFTLPLLLT